MRYALLAYPALLLGIAIAICIEKGVDVAVLVVAFATSLIALYLYHRSSKDKQSLA